jgi:hypothetical protein
MTSVGMICRLLNGASPNDSRISGGIEYLMKAPPSWPKDGAGVDLYYWFHANLALFQVGGDPGGRVYTTAMGALCLETYYRYSPGSR